MTLEGTEEHCVHCHAVAKPIAGARTTRSTAPPPLGGRPGSPTSPPRTSSTQPPPSGRRGPSTQPATVAVGSVQIPRAALVEGGTSVALAPSDSPVAKISAYLFARETLLVLIGLAIVTGALRWLGSHAWGPGGIATRGIAGGIEAAYYFHIIVHFAGGGEHLEMPDLSDLHEDLIDPLRRYVLTLVPMLAAIVWYGEKAFHDWTLGFLGFAMKPHGIFDYPGPGLLFAAALALWPLMTAIAAIGKSIIAAYNPILWVQTLRLFNTRYLLGAVVFYAVLAAEAYILPSLATAIDIPVVGTMSVQLVAMMLMALRGCVLGAVCEPYFRD